MAFTVVEVALEHPVTSPRLTAIDPAPAATASLLAPATRRVVELLHPQDLEPAGAGCEAERAGVRVHGLAGGRPVVLLPVDGPRAALAMALAGLRAWTIGRPEVPAVLLDLGPRGVPSPALLRLVADSGLLPAVDLTRLPWAEGDAVWVTTDESVVPLRLAGLQDRTGRDLAQALLDLRVLAAGTPATAWVRSVADGAERADPARWAAALRADHLAKTATALRIADQSGGGSRYGTPTS